MIYVYRTLLFLAYFAALLQRKKNPKIRAGLEMRRGDFFKVGPKGSRPIWIHCASGEFEYAKPVIREIKSRHPKTKILVTFFSPTFQKNIESFEGVDFSCPSPLDFKNQVSEFLDYHQPLALLVARTDIWPEALVQAGHRMIPTLLFSATLDPGAAKLSRFLTKLVFKWKMSLLDTILAVSESDRKAFESVGVRGVSTLGDTRFDQVVYRLNHRSKLPKIFESLAEPVFIFASTWSQDEEVVLPLFKDILATGARVILVPHEPTKENVTALESQMSQLGLLSLRLSQESDWAPNSVMIVDRTGILAELYSVSDFAFIGGSFKSNVHSVMEAIASGAQVFTGPKINNNREALEFSKIELSTGAPIVTVTNEGHELREKILSRLKLFSQDPVNSRKLKPQIIKLVNDRTGASKKVVDEVFKRIPDIF